MLLKSIEEWQITDKREVRRPRHVVGTMSSRKLILFLALKQVYLGTLELKNYQHFINVYYGFNISKTVKGEWTLTKL